ncbi:hypothetical protein [Ammoniphilus resinae]|uniref:Uncharacterized protein n=1 Tax=Ammoniphilus resinae TaxID=861532 RepID=A0ABS4GLC1_9BACL|nr:hypothetical protein [Ammoniphilus resinae]MBP1930907.1 hypothetical protein [Ammoniphilus resinae]
MAKENRAIAAINGTYFNGTYFNAYDKNDLMPYGAIMIDGTMKHFGGGPVAMGITEKCLTFGSVTEISVRGGINGSMKWPFNWYAWSINHAPTNKQAIIVFTCDFKTKNVSFPDYTYVVVCGGKVTGISQNKAMIPSDGFIIAYGAENQKELSRFHVGDTVNYEVQFPEKLQSQNHLIGVGPKLVSN